jgi:hypothetical protein
MRQFSVLSYQWVVSGGEGFNETCPSMKEGQVSTTHQRFTARIEGSPETIFGLIADMPN